MRFHWEMIRLVLLLALSWHSVYAVANDASPNESFPGEVSLFLPDVLHAVPGIEANVYFDNLVLLLNPANYVFDVTCNKGMQQAERWTYIPKEGEEGSYAFTVEVRNIRNEIIARASSVLTVHTAASLVKDTHSMLIIGDSLTHAGVYTQHLLDLGSQDLYPGISLIGSHGKDANVHEGYGGWTAKRFATHYTGMAREGHYKERGSPFLYEDSEGKRTLDFKRYCDDVNGGKLPEVITIFLGCNDTFSAIDETIEASIEEMLTHLDQLIAMIHQVAPTTRIGLIPAVPAAASQDAFGRNYRNGQTRWQYKRNQHAVVQTMYARYRGKEAEGISLIPAFVNLDCAYNYPAVEVAVNSRNEASVTRQNNGVHPNANGYRQIGDSVFCWLLSQ
jgi:lysophospholipase L1-like esterase